MEFDKGDMMRDGNRLKKALKVAIATPIFASGRLLSPVGAGVMTGLYVYDNRENVKRTKKLVDVI